MWKRRPVPTALAATTAVLLLAACQSSAQTEASPQTEPAASPSAAVDCATGDDFTAICDLQSPEDFQEIPGDAGQVLLARGNGPVYQGPSGFSVMDVESMSAVDVPITVGDQQWGEASCAPIEGDLNLHGMYVGELDSGALRVLAVNHAERESVEMYELESSGDGYGLTWRGCLEADEDDYLNDVTGLPNGEVAVSVMASVSALFAEDGFDYAFSGESTGYVLHSSGTDPLTVLPGTESPTPNGLTLSADGSTLYYLQYTAKKIAQYDMATGAIVKEADLSVAPDNMSVGTDGTLYTTGSLTVDDARTCSESGLADCAHPFGVDRIDPATLDVTSVDLPSGLPVESATVAVPVGDWLLISSTATNSIVRTQAS